MAGTVDLVQRSFTGMVLHDDAIWFDPLLPEEISRLEMRLHYRQHSGVIVDVTSHRLTVSSPPATDAAAPIKIGIRDSVVTVANGSTRQFDLYSPVRPSEGWSARLGDMCQTN